MQNLKLKIQSVLLYKKYIETCYLIDSN